MARIAVRMLPFLPAFVLFAAAVPVPFDLGLVVVLASGALLVDGARTPCRGFGRFDRLVALVGIAYLACSFGGHDAARSLVLGYPLFLGLVLYALVSRGRFDGRSIQAVSLSMALLAVVFSTWLLAAVPLGTDPQDRVDAAGNLLFIVPNDTLLLAFLAAMSVPLISARRLEFRLLAGFVWILAFSVGFTLASRGLLLTLMIAMTCWIMLNWQRRLGVSLMLGVGLVLVLVLEILLQGPFSAKFNGLWDGRIPLWHSAWLQFVEAPLFGQGPGTFGLLHLPPEEPYGRFLDTRVTPWPHNLSLEVLAGGGLALAMAFLALGMHALRVLARLVRKAGSHRLMCSLAFIVLCVVSLFEASLLRLWFTLSLFTLLGLLNALEVTHSVSANHRLAGAGADARRTVDPLGRIRS